MSVVLHRAGVASYSLASAELDATDLWLCLLLIDDSSFQAYYTECSSCSYDSHSGYDNNSYDTNTEYKSVGYECDTEYKWHESNTENKSDMKLTLNIRVTDMNVTLYTTVSFRNRD